MEKFVHIKSTAVCLLIENIDTDQIIPARFLKATDRMGFGNNLFRDWRFNKDGSKNLNFELNKQTGKILVAGNNFGCGSSREHAAWAIFDYGFRAIVSTFFADIFKNNALNNGILPIQVSQQEYEQIVNKFNTDNNTEFEVDLEKQKFICKNNFEIDFEVDDYKKDCLLNGFDDIDFLTSNFKEILEFEKTTL